MRYIASTPAERIRYYHDQIEYLKNLISEEYKAAAVRASEERKGEEYTPYYIILSSTHYVEFACKHPDHAMNKANKELGHGNWKAILTKQPSQRWQRITLHEARIRIHSSKAMFEHY